MDSGEDAGLALKLAQERTEVVLEAAVLHGRPLQLEYEQGAEPMATQEGVHLKVTAPMSRTLAQFEIPINLGPNRMVTTTLALAWHSPEELCNGEESCKAMPKLSIPMTDLTDGAFPSTIGWEIEIEKLRTMSQLLIGDSMLAAGFVSYVGAFDIAWRTQLWKDTWLPDLTERQVPMSEVIDPMTTLVSEAQSNTMVSQGLPADRVSLENGAIILQAKRWPLIIDPQVQGIKWLRGKEKDNGLAVIQLSQKTWIK